MRTKPLVQGGALVLVLLVMLSVIAFGALSLMSAYADVKLARTASAWIEQYYELEAAANEELQHANGLLEAAYPAGFSEDSLQDLVQDGWLLEGETLSRDIMVSDGELTQNLRVELMPSSPDENGRYYRILCWKQWQSDFTYEEEGSGVWLG